MSRAAPAALAFALALVACGGESRPADPGPPPPPPPPVHGDAGGADSASAPPLAYPAIRCAECHNKMHDEWSTAGHAQAARSPIYRKVRAQAGEQAAGCDACHAPLAKRLPAGDLAIDEGVTCEVCHNIKAVTARNAGAGFELVFDGVKYGPLCDSKDHYFHRMGCSPLHAESTLCAGCHLYYRPLPGGGELPVYTEYAEWAEGPYQARDCQTCHMPGSRAEVAEGNGPRDGVGHHGLLGERGDLRKRALAATAAVTAAVGDRLRIDVRVENVGAGHAVPSGQPERRILVRATALAARGAPQAAAEQAFGRFLVDAAGKPAPFHAATRVRADERIGPHEVRTARLELAAPEAGELVIEVLWRAFDAEIGAALEIPAVDEVPLLRARIPLGAPRAGRRPELPRTIELER